MRLINSNLFGWHLSSAQALQGSAESSSQKETALPPAQKTTLFSAAALCVWSCWLSMSVAAIYLIAHYAGNMPFMDEFSMIPWLTHNQPMTLSWLWAQHNEHRIPLSKLIQLGLGVISNCDFRAGMYFTVLLMSVLSACLVETARQVRGHISYTDAFFPIALLNWGHYENFLWSFQVAFSLSTFLIGVLLILIVHPRAAPVRANGQIAFVPTLIAGTCMLMLPLCGIQGTVLVPLLALWIILAGSKSLLRSRSFQLNGTIAIVLPLLACGIVALFYAVGYSVPPRPFLIMPTTSTALEFFSTGLGCGARSWWPWVVSLLGVLSTIVLLSVVITWKSFSRDRTRIAGMLLFLLGMVALAGAVGRGRSFLGPGSGLASRYALLSVPFFLALYLGAARWRIPPFSRFVQNSLVLLVVVLSMRSFHEGKGWAHGRRASQQRLDNAIDSGLTIAEIAHTCGPSFYPNKNQFAESLEMMKNANSGPYRLK